MQRYLEFVANHAVLSALFVGLLLALIVVEFQSRARGAFNLSSFDFTRQLNSGNAVLIDLRPGAEFDRGHIRGARHLTPSQVDPAARDLVKYKDGVVLLYCQSGITSVDVAGRLLKAGFAQVYSLKGGITAWVQDQLPLERGKSR
jgi:rhodanese-related sulfurtransferase